MHTHKSKNKDQHAKNIFQPFFLTFSPILSIISPFPCSFKGGKSCGGLSTLSKNLSKNRIFHPFSMNFFFSYRESAMGNSKTMTVLPENQVFASKI